MQPTQLTRIAAYGLILRVDEILLCRLSSSVPQYAGKWTLPGGGIEFGESPPAAMVREVEEETGLIVEPNGIADINSIVLQQGSTQRHSIRILYHASIVSGTLRHETAGTTDRCQWWHKEKCPPLVSLAEAGVSIAFPAA